MMKGDWLRAPEGGTNEGPRLHGMKYLSRLEGFNKSINGLQRK